MMFRGSLQVHAEWQADREDVTAVQRTNYWDLVSALRQDLVPAAGPAAAVSEHGLTASNMDCLPKLWP